MSDTPQILQLYRRVSRWPCGNWLFSRMVCLRAPYFGSIAPRIEQLVAGRCVASMRQRRVVQNHIGTVHAIALCNLAELTAGLVSEASVPTDMRWIPKGMGVEYTAKARGRMQAAATPEIPVVSAPAGYELPIAVSVKDAQNTEVLRARITMWITPRR